MVLETIHFHLISDSVGLEKNCYEEHCSGKDLEARGACHHARPIVSTTSFASSVAKRDRLVGSLEAIPNRRTSNR